MVIYRGTFFLSRVVLGDIFNDEMPMRRHIMHHLPLLTLSTAFLEIDSES